MKHWLVIKVSASNPSRVVNTCGSVGHAATTHTCRAHETFMIQLEWNELCHNDWISQTRGAAKYQPAALNTAIKSENHCKIALHSRGYCYSVIKQTVSITFVKTTQQQQQRQNEIKLRRAGETLNDSREDCLCRPGEIIRRDLIRKTDFYIYKAANLVEQLLLQSWRTKAFHFALQICFEAEQLRLLITSHSQSWSRRRVAELKMIW